MKRMLALVILFSFSAPSMQAQSEWKKGSYVGVGLSAFKAGFGQGFLISPQTGLFVKAPVADGLYIRPEVAYSQRGDASLNYTTRVSLEYVDVALVAEYDVTLRESWGLTVHAMAGPQWSQLLHAAYEIDSSTETRRFDAFGRTSHSDLGLLFGAGVAIGIGNGSLFADARFYYGTTELEVFPFAEPMLPRAVIFVAGFEF